MCGMHCGSNNEGENFTLSKNTMKTPRRGKKSIFHWKSVVSMCNRIELIFGVFL